MVKKIATLLIAMIVSLLCLAEPAHACVPDWDVAAHAGSC